MSFDDFMRHMMRDKKVLAGELRLVLPTGIGQAEVIGTTPLSIVEQAILSGK
jgi:3-dehydroquinate synthase